MRVYTIVLRPAHLSVCSMPIAQKVLTYYKPLIGNALLGFEPTGGS